MSLQEELYDFPYHFLPDAKTPTLSRTLDWGLKYWACVRHVADMVRELHPTTMLDVGCGDGRLLAELRSNVPERAGVDTSFRAVQMARALVPGADFHVGSASDLKGKFDLVTCIHTLEHIQPDECTGFVKTLADRLAPGGALIVAVPSVVRPVNPKHYQHFSEGTLRTILAPHFDVQSCQPIVANGNASRWAKRVIVNRFYTLNWTPAVSAVWQLHDRLIANATAANGEQWVALARPKRDNGNV